MNPLSLAFLYKTMEDHRAKINDYTFELAVAKIKDKPDYIIHDIIEAREVCKERLNRLEKELDV